MGLTLKPLCISAGCEGTIRKKPSGPSRSLLWGVGAKFIPYPYRFFRLV